MLTEIGKQGVLGLILVVTMYDNFKMKSKIFNVIENNTKAMTELKNSIKK
jgi:hypothetical protein